MGLFDLKSNREHRDLDESITLGGPNEGLETLAIWRMEEVANHEKITDEQNADKSFIDSLPQIEGNWPDETSKQVERRLNGKGIYIPWRYHDSFGDKYKVIGLRAGGIGIVLFVESTDSENQIYAAKTLQPFLQLKYLEKPAYVQQKIANAFLAEALPWLELGQHPSIVTVHILKNIEHPSTGKNVPFIFSELIESGDLKKLIDDGSRFSLEEALSFALQICEGLLHAYKHGLAAHRDLKPDNIMVYKDAIYQITDFSAGVIGTPGYMAPEQVACRLRLKDSICIDHRADQFTIGLMLLYVLTGRNPFYAQLRQAAFITNKAKKLLEEGMGEIPIDYAPDSLRSIINRCLSPNPSDRFVELLELRHELLNVYRTELGGNYEFPEVELHDSAQYWFDRGNSFFNVGRNANAVIPFWMALRRFKTMLGKDAEQGDCFKYLGVAYEGIGRRDESETCIREALRIFTESREATVKQAECLANLGNIFFDSGRFSEAEKEYEEALNIFMQYPETLKKQAICLENLGDIYSSTSRRLESKEKYTAALRMFQGISGTELNQARCLMKLGNVFRETDDALKAEEKYREAFEIFITVPGTDIDQASCLLNEGSAYLRAEAYRRASYKYAEALDRFKKIPGTELSQVKCLQGIGTAYTEIGNFSEAEERYKEALAIYDETSQGEPNQVTCLLYLGNLYTRTSEFDKAQEVLNRVLDICQRYPHGTEQMRLICLELLKNSTQQSIRREAGP